MTLRKEKKSNENKNFETNFFFSIGSSFFVFLKSAAPFGVKKKGES